ncbi:MAG: hypothetical protein ACLGGX_05920 [Bdellovibrionia bacterium]
MFTKWIISITFLFVASFTSLAQAQVRSLYPKVNVYKELQQIIKDYRANCADPFYSSECTLNYGAEVLFVKYQNINKLEKNTQIALEKIAYEQAQVWADTILEGDYVAEGDTYLTSVVGIYRDQELIAYHLMFGEEAYYTGDKSCRYYEEQQSLEGCEKGEILEGAFVSKDFKAVLNDDLNYPEFHN